MQRSVSYRYIQQTIWIYFNATYWNKESYLKILKSASVKLGVTDGKLL